MCIRDRAWIAQAAAALDAARAAGVAHPGVTPRDLLLDDEDRVKVCLLYTSDAAEERALVLDPEHAVAAGHRGSAFGGIGCGPQPSHGAFGEAVREACAAARRDRVLWVEDEGPFIGSVGVPAPLAAAMAWAPTVEVRASRPERVDRVAREYGAAAPEELLGALARLRRRLGAARADGVAALIADGRIGAAVDALLPYYDAAYRRRIARRLAAAR